MFRSVFQGGPAVEVFSSTGHDPMGPWHATMGLATRRVYDKEVKGYVYAIGSSGSGSGYQPGPTSETSPPSSSLRSGKARMILDPSKSSTDRHSHGLHLVQRYLVLQLRIDGASTCPSQTSQQQQKHTHFNTWSLELTLTDSASHKRRLILTTAMVRDTVKVDPLHARISLALLRRGTWLNLCIDLESLVQGCYGSSASTSSIRRGGKSSSSSQVAGDHSFFKSLDSISIGPGCNIKRIFTLKTRPQDSILDEQLVSAGPKDKKTEPIPQKLALHTECKNSTQIVNMATIRRHLGQNPDHAQAIGFSAQGTSLGTNLQLRGGDNDGARGCQRRTSSGYLVSKRKRFRKKVKGKEPERTRTGLIVRPQAAIPSRRITEREHIEKPIISAPLQLTTWSDPSLTILPNIPTTSNASALVSSKIDKVSDTVPEHSRIFLQGQQHMNDSGNDSPIEIFSSDDKLESSTSTKQVPQVAIRSSEQIAECLESCNHAIPTSDKSVPASKISVESNEPQSPTIGVELDLPAEMEEIHKTCSSIIDDSNDDFNDIDLPCRSSGHQSRSTPSKCFVSLGVGYNNEMKSKNPNDNSEKHHTNKHGYSQGFLDEPLPSSDESNISRQGSERRNIDSPPKIYDPKYFQSPDRRGSLIQEEEEGCAVTEITSREDIKIQSHRPFSPPISFPSRKNSSGNVSGITHSDHISISMRRNSNGSAEEVPQNSFLLSARNDEENESGESDGEEELDLLFDPQLQCYYDPETHKMLQELSLTLILSTITGIPIFLTFDSGISLDSINGSHKDIFSSQLSFVWGASPQDFVQRRDAYKDVSNGKALLSYYMPYSRAPSASLGFDLNFWLDNYPEFVLYKCDKKTVAFWDGQSAPHGSVPLDFTNPAVIDWQVRNQSVTAKTLGYDAM
eukprot:UC4_evm4s1335